MGLVEWVRRRREGRLAQTPGDDGPAPRAWAQHLRRAVAHLPEGGAVADHVLTGREGGVLAVLAQRAAASSYVWYPQAPDPLRSPDPRAVHALYRTSGDVDPVVLRRWASVLEAVQAPVPGWQATIGPLAGAQWPDIVLTQLGAVTPGTGPLPATFADLVRIAAVDGADARDVVQAMLTISPGGRYHLRKRVAQLHRLPGLGDALHTHPELVVAALRDAGDTDARTAVLDIVDGALTDEQLAAVADALATAATGTNGTVRTRAEPVLARAPGAAEALRTVAVEGSPPARRHALTLLARRPSERAWARGTALADRASSVRGLVEQWDAATAADERPADDVVVDPLPPIRWAVPRERAEACVRRLVDDLTARLAAEDEERRSRRPGRTARGWTHAGPPPGTHDHLVDLLVSDAGPPSAPTVSATYWVVTAALRATAADGALDAVATVKLLAAFDLLGPRFSHWGAPVVEAVHDRTGAPDLRTLAALLDGAGADGRTLVWEAYRDAHAPFARTWDAGDVGPFVAENLDLVMDDTEGDRFGVDGLARFAAVAAIAQPPTWLVDRLLGVALGARVALRAPAQDALAGTPGLARLVAAALADGRSDVRLVAAQWSARLADPAVLPALQAAWAKERQDVVRGALLDALLAVGESAETYLDPAGTGAAAAKAVAKGLPVALSWCAWDTLPTVRWASSGEAVPLEVVQWWCATAVRSRSPEPDAVLRHYAALLEPAGRRQLAHHLLTAWLQVDAASSGVASKGVLAVVAACGGREVVDPAVRYVREWYGQRAAQGKALLAMLAWVDDPAATQAVLAIGSRFRTRSLQDEALAQAAALAERKGWTVDELADRTIPTGGFDDDGVLELPYGPRTFVARLLPDLTVELRDPDGRPLKALPPPRAADDPAVAKETRAAFTAAKKDVRTIATLQQQRLHEALCTERSWSAPDWQQYLAGHPVVGPLVRRLVWVAAADGTEPVVFRPLDDGTLTDVDDEPVTLPPDARVRLAHDTVVAPEQSAAWTAHLADYEVAPLFAQLGRELRTVSAEERSLVTLTDFEGHVLASSAFRNRATRLGWTRAPAEDGGWVVRYLKRFPTLGIDAEIDFTGTPLPDEGDRPVAVRALAFSRHPPGGTYRRLVLGDVPAVLLSECWHDVRQIAAQGTGYDPDWRRTTAYP